MCVFARIVAHAQACSHSQLLPSNSAGNTYNTVSSMLGLWPSVLNCAGCSTAPPGTCAARALDSVALQIGCQGSSGEVACLQVDEKGNDCPD